MTELDALEVTTLTPRDLDEPYLNRDLRTQSEKAVVRVEVESLERGALTVYLEPGESFEVTEDGPNKVTTTVL